MADITGSLLDLKWQRQVCGTRSWWIHDRRIQVDSACHPIEYRSGGHQNRLLNLLTLLGPVWDLKPFVWPCQERGWRCCCGRSSQDNLVLGQLRFLLRPKRFAWLMYRGPLDSGVWLSPGICYLYKARLRAWLRLLVALIHYEV